MNLTNQTIPGREKNPKRSARISVAIPLDDWLYQKFERLNTVVAEGYPSRAQDSAGQKRDQFVKIPKSQSRWYQMHTIKPDGPHRPGKTIFSWHNTKAKVNSQFPLITWASAYPITGPASRLSPRNTSDIGRSVLKRIPILFTLQVSIGARVSCKNACQHMLTCCSRINKGKAPKEVLAALGDLKDLMAFHQNVSVAMGTALQHLADSLVIHLSILILIRRDSYLDHLKVGIKQDQLRNAPLFGLDSSLMQSFALLSRILLNTSLPVLL